VDRAGVAALARVTRVLVRAGLALAWLFRLALDFTVDFLTIDFRAVERVLPLTF